jgi:murein DD-endopeptidase MepM/ murein hydrolase activator NlpD
MRTLSRLLVGVVILGGVIGGGAYYLAGDAPGPTIDIERPATAIGLESQLEMSIESPDGPLTRVEAYLVQMDQRFPLFSLDRPEGATLTQESAERLRVARAFGRRTFPALNQGEAELVVTAARPVLFGLREAESTVRRELRLLFEPPRVQVLSTQHFVNHGGAEMAVYRVTPPEAESGVRVGDRMFPGYPAAGGGLTAADPSTRIAFFALAYDQDLNTPIEVVGIDEARNVGRTPLEHRSFAKTFRRSRLSVSDDFFRRVVPPILDRTDEVSVDLTTADGLLQGYLAVNGELRRINAETIASFADQTDPSILWDGPFRQLGNSQVESGFADHRTYVYDGREVDQQVHLGFDLASTAQTPIEAANRGRVLFADYLGIYGNAVIVDHGMGVQSLYAHLSSIDVAVGQTVEKGAPLGRSGTTGLAGGDHLHFTMLVHGQPVNPVEWWDPHWLEDRIFRKLEAVGGE